MLCGKMKSFIIAAIIASNTIGICCEYFFPGNSKSSGSTDAGVGEKEGDKKWSSGSWLFVGAGLIAVALHGHRMGYF